MANPYDLPSPPAPTTASDPADNAGFIADLTAAAKAGGGPEHFIVAPVSFSGAEAFWQRVAERLTEWELKPTGFRDGGLTRYLAPKSR